MNLQNPDFSPSSTSSDAIVLLSSDSYADGEDFYDTQTVDLEESDPSFFSAQYSSGAGSELQGFQNGTFTHSFGDTNATGGASTALGSANVEDAAHFNGKRDVVEEAPSKNEMHRTVVEAVTDVNGGGKPIPAAFDAEGGGDKWITSEERHVEMSGSVGPLSKFHDTTSANFEDDGMAAGSSSSPDNNVLEIEPDKIHGVDLASDHEADPNPESEDNHNMQSEVMPDVEMNADGADVVDGGSRRPVDTEGASVHAPYAEMELYSMGKLHPDLMSTMLLKGKATDNGILPDQSLDGDNDTDICDVSLASPSSGTDIQEVVQDDLKGIKLSGETLFASYALAACEVEGGGASITGMESAQTLDVAMETDELHGIKIGPKPVYVSSSSNAPSVIFIGSSSSPQDDFLSAIEPTASSLGEARQEDNAASFPTMGSGILPTDNEGTRPDGDTRDVVDSTTIAGDAMVNRIAPDVNQMYVPYSVYGGAKVNGSNQPYVVFEDAELEKTKEAIVEVSAIESAYTDEAFVEVSVIKPEGNHEESLFSEDSAIIDHTTPGDHADLYVTASEYSMWSINPKTGDHEFDPGPLAVDFYCNVCQRSLPLGSFRIRCVECVDFDLCISCACKGPDRNNHSSDHKYIPISPNSFPLFGDWTADEELLLLEGISKYGFGNWNQVADMVNRLSPKNKTASECENHYAEHYIRSKCSPFPDIRSMRASISDPSARDRLYNFFYHVQKNHRIDRASANVATNPAPSNENLHHIDIIPPAVDLVNSGTSLVRFFQHFNGYNIYRDELDSEYNNDAEMIIKDLEFEPWDTPAEIEFKLRLVEIYNSMIDDRIMRKRLLIHRFWNDHPTRENGFLSMDQIEKTAYWRLSPLIRFQTEEEHLELTKLIVTRVEVEKRLRLVNTWYSLGLRTVDDIERFEMQKMPCPGATGYVEDIHPIARSLFETGQVTESDLNELTDQLINRFCSEFSISKTHLDSMIADIEKLNDGSPFELDEDAAVIPTWDICFEDGVKLDDNSVAAIPPSVDIDISTDTDCHPRLIVDDDRYFECPSIDVRQLKFSSSPESAVQQSQTFPGHRACMYVAKLLPNVKARMRKGTVKRRRQPQLSDDIRRFQLRR